jgi:alpha-beta hydrolase superfamily lysophospholipase
MRRLSVGRLASLLFTGLAFTLLPAPARAQNAQPDKITFDTIDGVEIQGDWYPSAKANKAPTALLVHKLGGDRKQLSPLAEKLVDEGFSVLTFDLRGHGASTSVKANTFWGVQANVRGIRQPANNKNSIDVKNFDRSYYGHMVNDLAAAKYFLEKKNNGRECNVNDLVLVGADDGGTLTALWLLTEWDRRRLCAGPMGIMKPGEPEGKDIAAAVFLSLRPSLGTGAKSMPVDLRNVFSATQIKDPGAKAALREKTGYCFIFGGEDNSSATLSNSLYTNTLAAEKNKLKLTYRVELKKTKLAGADLLGNELKTEELVTKYLKDRVFDARKSTAWEERDLKQYPLAEVPAKQYGIPTP